VIMGLAPHPGLLRRVAGNYNYDPGAQGGRPATDLLTVASLLASLFFLRLLGLSFSAPPQDVLTPISPGRAQPVPSAAYLTRTRVQFAAETKCARYLGASDDENLWVGISWFTFLLQSSPPASPSQNETSWSVAKS
jgi:hypothetical protein